MMDLTTHWVGVTVLALFVASYVAVVAEDRLYLRKSVPVLLAAGLSWPLIGIAYAMTGDTHTVGEEIRHVVEEYAELFLFLIVAMTYVNTMGERGLFDALRSWLSARRFSLRALFWITGGLAFCISPFADNLTTALIMGTVAVAVGEGHPRFISLACINIVVAANAGGSFSPFGDITTLMVWQAGVIPFTGFFALFLPALVNWLVTAAILSLFVGSGTPAAAQVAGVREAGAIPVLVLFLGTISTTVLMQSLLGIPPFIGMMLGLGVLKAYSYGFNLRVARSQPAPDIMEDVFGQSAVLHEETDSAAEAPAARPGPAKPIPIFQLLERVEWDTLMFFYGVMLAIGALGTVGYLQLASALLFDGFGEVASGILVGVLSAVVDNVPIMFVVLSMNPPISEGGWLLVTLTSGVGGSILSIGSVAGVALMGQARGNYTFMSHLRWSWAVALGYAASVAVHLLLNRDLFQ